MPLLFRLNNNDKEEARAVAGSLFLKEIPEWGNF
jgi:hypothetical protein